MVRAQRTRMIERMAHLMHTDKEARRPKLDKRKQRDNNLIDSNQKHCFTKETTNRLEKHAFTRH
jgi:hypothetical protein